MTAGRGTPLQGERATQSVANPALHASDHEDGALTIHLPEPSAAGSYARDNGTNWESVLGLLIADLADYARGSIIRGGATAWETYNAKTLGTILAGDGTDLVATANPYISGTLTLANEGLHILDTNASHDLIVKAGSDLTLDRILTLATGDAARAVTLSGNPTLDDWFDQSVKAAASPLFAGVTLGNTGLHLLDTNASHDLIIAPGSDLTGDRTLTIVTGDADRTLTLANSGTAVVGTGTATRLAEWSDANTIVASTLIKTGAGVLTLDAGGACTLTVPETGTAALLATANVFTAMQTITATQDASLSAEYITAAADRDFSAAPNWSGTNWARPNTGDIIDVTVAAAGKTWTRAAGSYITDGFQVGMTVTWTGFANPANNGDHVITTLTALVMTCSASTPTDEAAGATVSCVSNVYSHATVGANAATLANVNLTAPPANGDIFQITITVVTKTADTLTVSIGGVAMAAVIGKVAGTLTAYVFNIAATGAGVLTVTPGATWLGWIDDVSVKLVNQASSILTGKLVGGTTVLETRMPNSTSLGVGIGALQGSVQLSSNGFGYFALQNNTGANSNGFGYAALQNNTGANSNGFGYTALYNNTGTNSNGFGYFALYNNTGANSNGFGYAALYNNTGANNNGFGYAALYENTTGAGNAAFGHNAGRGFTDNNYCTFLGYDTRTSVRTLTNAIVIGANARGAKSNQVTLGHTDVVETLLRGTVLVNTTTVGAQLAVDQASTTGALPVLLLDQGDESEEFIEFDAAVGASMPIDTAALGAYYGKVRVSVNGTFKYMALYDS